MNDFREINKGKIEAEVHGYLRLSGAMIDKLVNFAFDIGAITDSEKEELVKKIKKEKEKIKEEFKYGCM